MKFIIAKHLEITGSTNEDARSGVHGEVFVADAQTAGRGRLNHSWHSAPKRNVIMSAVLSVADLDFELAATFPLVAGLSVAEAVLGIAGVGAPVAVKWPNDVMWNGKKLAGILCQRHGDLVVCGIGVNVLERDFPEEIKNRATSLALEGVECSVEAVQSRILDVLGDNYEEWRRNGFGAVLQRLRRYDFLRGKYISVYQDDGGAHPTSGLCAGIKEDGTLDVGGVSVAAGEAHVDFVVGMRKGSKDET